MMGEKNNGNLHLTVSSCRESVLHPTTVKDLSSYVLLIGYFGQLLKQPIFPSRQWWRVTLATGQDMYGMWITLTEMGDVSHAYIT